jgi:Fe2+ transport system protein FeoA
MEAASERSAVAGDLAQRQSCPLCQAEFDPSCANCSSGCPMAKGCSVLTCPSCGYSFPKPTGLSAWLARFFASRRAQTLERSEGRSLSDVSAGQRVRVIGVAPDGGERLSKLAAFGIVEGSELFVRQRVPALVIEVGETTLALDAEVARAVRVSGD